MTITNSKILSKVAFESIYLNYKRLNIYFYMFNIEIGDIIKCVDDIELDIIL